MFARETSLHVKYRRLRSDFTPAINAHTRHQIILVWLFGITNPSSNRIKFFLKSKLSNNVPNPYAFRSSNLIIFRLTRIFLRTSLPLKVDLRPRLQLCFKRSNNAFVIFITRFPV